jgi:hypothetical protein
MIEKVSLYYYKGASVTIYVDAYFKEGNLVVEGIDIGKSVEDAWGDSDYEYSITVKKDNLDALCNSLGIETDNQDVILKKMEEKFSGEKGFPAFSDFLRQNGIDFDPFSWN